MSALADADRRWLDSAARIARPYVGGTGAAPAAAALIVDTEQRVVGRGITGPDGEPTAVAAALAEAGEFAIEASCYTTIEPSWDDCVSLIEARVQRAIIGIADPARQQEGINALIEAGAELEVVYHAPSLALHEAYSARVSRQVPFVTLVLAVSSDGMVGRRDGLPATILGERARRWLALQRRMADALVTGLRPLDTTTIPGLPPRDPLQVILVGTRDPQVPATGRSILIAMDRRAQSLPANVEAVEVEGRSGRPDLRVAMSMLAGRGINLLHVEAGPRLSESFIGLGLVDRLYLLDGTTAIGRGGIPATALGTIEARLRAAGYAEVARTELGSDRLTTFERTL